MTLPVVTRAQLEPLLDRLIDVADDPAPLVLVRADPESAPAEASAGGQTVRIVASSSPLEIRAHASRQRDQPLVVLTGCDTTTLGDDLLARAVRRKLHTVNRWETVSQLFGAEHVSQSLAQHKYLADALIEARPLVGYPAITNKMLDLETALEALIEPHLGLVATSLADVLLWGTHSTAARAVRESSNDVIEQLEQHLATQYGPGISVVFAALRAGKSAELMALCLAADVIFSTDTPAPDARLRLELELGEPGLTDEMYRNAAQAVVSYISGQRTDEARTASWLTAGDRLVQQWGLAESSTRSSVLPSGFTARIGLAATALASWKAKSANPSLQAEADRSIVAVEDHVAARAEPRRVERLRMAQRVIRRGFEMQTATTTADAFIDYTLDGAWLDRARIALSQSDTEPAAAALYAALSAETDAAVLANAGAQAPMLAGAAQALGDRLIGIEDVLDTVVAPLAATAPTLVVVLDGMSWPNFTDVLDALSRQGWAPYIDEDAVVAKPVVAALPTVTELSRTSLLCGTLRSGDKSSETRAFTKYPSLVAASDAEHPPTLFHKTDLRSGGLDTIPHEQLATISDPRVRVVGIVLNNIDERLKDVAHPPSGWGLDELSPLREILEAARSAGRAIVLTSDHGHILERKSESRVGGGGERWRGTDTGPAADGEILVSGPRVVNDEHAVVLPWIEQLRYGPSKNGYHGGLTLAEATVPLAVLSTEDIEGWEPTSITPPDWWHAAPPVAPASDDVAPKAAPRKKAPEVVVPSLFDPEPEPAATTTGIEAVMASDHVQSNLAALRLDAAVVTTILSVLDGTGGTSLAEDRVAERASVPKVRIGRIITQMQRLLNIDGYPVIETSNGHIKFDRALLERQLGL
ncbi:BREX-2 system phosphatase PglZ [Ilumatobacter coccineus]|uniref:Putative phage resistance protein PglZ n=1 Tax=Ilumatobacter coccineus (strain NBRC 103263 / KCTC 29153 / YM16-304) TaxID=1313172 RepID=A0A6C7EHE3_ILUCY|nr:BREX-2 system phosphatase PglZ [Ilumatobacter coccineus]BAN04395.1 putative phage resistance protein PglZ [Ilumatobacter coccineus YM16-304]